MKYALISFFGLACSASFFACCFEREWLEMQDVYKVLSAACDQERLRSEDVLTHAYWKSNQNAIRDLILGKPDQHFFNFPPISGTMVSRGYDALQKYEILYLTYCIDEATRKKIAFFRETSFGSIPIEINEFNCTANSLGQLYVAARVLETVREYSLRSIIEFGGGFGNLARIFRQIDPTITYVIIDFPELLALQYMYLKNTLPDAHIIVHTRENAGDIDSGYIHLVPVYFADTLNVKADCFISRFGLSEATDAAQHLMLKKRFYDARFLYVVGQLQGWRAIGSTFVGQKTLLDGIRAAYKNVTCQPFHSPDLERVPSYEVEACIQK